MFWPGSDVEIEGYYPTYYYKYDGSVSFQERCDVIIEWLSYPVESRPTFLTLYFEEPDHTEHLYGPDDPRVDAAIKDVDHYLGYLLDRMEELDYRRHVDIIVVSDHGMTATPPEKNIYLDDYNVTLATVSQMYDPNYQNVDGWVVAWSPVCTIIPAEGRAGVLLTNLGNVPNLTAYTNDTIALNPNWYVVTSSSSLIQDLTCVTSREYCCNARITQVVLVADPGYTILTRARYNPDSQLLGGHGYDNTFIDMQAIFVANGCVTPPYITFFFFDLYSYIPSHSPSLSQAAFPTQVRANSAPPQCQYLLSRLPNPPPPLPAVQCYGHRPRSQGGVSEFMK